MNFGNFYILLFFLVGISFGIIVYLIAFLIQPYRPDKVKQSTYECGLETIGPAWIKYDIKYYLYALLFVIFDVETVFLYPWAVSFRKLGLFAFIEMVIFIAILLLGLAYAWRKGILKWRY